MTITNPNDSYLEKRIRDLEQMLRANPLESSSVSNGRLRFIGGLLRVDSGGSVEIVGTLDVDGATEISGAFTLSGQDWSISGDGTISGDVIVTGTLNVTGNSAFGGTLNIGGATTIDGDTTLNSDLTVSGSGRVQVGSGMTLTPATDGGAVVFSNGSKLSANSSSIGLTKGTSTVRIGDSTAGLLAESNSITVSGSGVQINLAAIPTESASGLPSGALSITGGGFLRRAA